MIDEIVREGARRMLAEALQAEVDAYIAQFTDERDEGGRRLVVRNGTHQPREVLTWAGAVEVVAPRVNDRRIDPDTGERCRFSSAILPPWCRKTPKITEVLPLLYLHGLSSGDFVPALGQFLGSTAGLSAPVITKLTEAWKAEQRSFAERDLSGVDYVYLWVDGIVRHEAPQDRVEVKRPPPPGCRGSPVKLRAARLGKRRGRWEAALTTPGRTGTARRCGFGKRDGKAYVRNQRVKPLNRPTNSNLADMGWVAVRTDRRMPVGNSLPELIPFGGRPR